MSSVVLAEGTTRGSLVRVGRNDCQGLFRPIILGCGLTALLRKLLLSVRLWQYLNKASATQQSPAYPPRIRVRIADRRSAYCGTSLSRESP